MNESPPHKTPGEVVKGWRKPPRSGEVTRVISPHNSSARGIARKKNEKSAWFNAGYH
jgi:hypothetical protein